jgi:hypothetical protein
MGMFIIQLLPYSNIALVIAIKIRAKGKFHMVTIFLTFHRNMTLTKATYFSKLSYCTSFQGLNIRDTSVHPPNNFLLHSVIMDSGKLKSMSQGCPPMEHNTHQIFAKICQMADKLKWEGRNGKHIHVCIHMYTENMMLRSLFLALLRKTAG